MQIAVKRKKLGKKLLTIGGGHQYLFLTKHNLNITMIDADHVKAVLAVKEACCGGPKKTAYFIATEQEIARWEV